MMKNIFLFLSVIYLGLGLYLYIAQRSFIYFPVAANHKNIEQVIFTHQGHRLSISVLNQGQDKAILYYGGNAEDVDHNAQSFSRLFHDHTVYLVHYRGYGRSSGKPSEPAIYADALYVFDQLRGHYDDMSLIGRSLGSAVATYVASERAIQKLALITPFDSVQRLAQAQFPFYPMALLLKDRHDSIGRVKQIQVPTLILAADQDQIVKLTNTKRLLAAFSPTTPVSFHLIPGVDHNDISGHPSYGKLLADFF